MAITERTVLRIDTRELLAATRQNEALASQVERIKREAATREGGPAGRSFGPGLSAPRPTSAAGRFAASQAQQVGIGAARAAVGTAALGGMTGIAGGQVLGAAAGAVLGGTGAGIAMLAAAVILEIVSGNGPPARRFEQWLERLVKQFVPPMILDAIERQERIRVAQAEAAAASKRNAADLGTRLAQDPRVAEEAARVLEAAHRARMEAEAAAVGSGGGVPGGL